MIFSARGGKERVHVQCIHPPENVLLNLSVIASISNQKAAVIFNFKCLLSKVHKINYILFHFKYSITF